MPRQRALLARRNALAALAAGGAAAAAALAARVATGPRAPGSQPQGSTDPADSRSGYRETAHVRNYYRTTRI